MPRRQIQVLPVADFTGGLNFRSDAFQLRANESPDMLNVDVDPLGGFGMRKTMGPFGIGSFDQAITNLMPYTNRGGTKQVIASFGARLAFSTGGAWTTILSGTNTELIATVSTVQRGANFLNPITPGEALYLQNGVDAVRKWTGANNIGAALGVTFQDDLAAAAGTADMPIAYCIAPHTGYMWVANTTESAVRYPNRLRWSHPNKPEDWRNNDYIDVDPSDGDEITALASQGGRLYVFKNRSIHVVTGVGATSFSVEKLTSAVGAVSQEAVVETGQGIYFYSMPEGLFRLQGGNAEWLFERLQPATTDGSIPQAYVNQVRVGWLNRRVWLSVPWGSAATTNNRTFLFDPTLNEGQGAFVAYDVGFNAFLFWNPGGQAATAIGARTDQARTMKLEVKGSEDTWATDYATLRSTTTDYPYAGDAAVFDFASTDFDVRVKVALDTWTPAGVVTLLSKWRSDSGVNQRSYKLNVFTSGAQTGLRLMISTNGTAEITKDSTATIVIANGAIKYLRYTLDINNGAAGYDIKFYTSDTGATWTKLGATVTTATAITTLFNSTSHLRIGSHSLDFQEKLLGKFYWADFWSGLGGPFADGGATSAVGTLVASPDFSVVESSVAATWVDAQSNNWFPFINLTTYPYTQTRSNSIASYYVTRWFDADNSALVKKWKRPELVVDGDNTLVLNVNAYLNYTPDDVRRAFTVSPTADQAYLVWDDGTGAANMKWYDGGASLNQWTRTLTGGSQEILRGSLLGRGRSVQLKVIGPAPTSVPWSVNAINFKFLPKRMRG